VADKSRLFVFVGVACKNTCCAGQPDFISAGRHGCVAMHRERAVVTDIAAGVGEILAFHLGSDRAKITNDSRLIDDLGADSLDVVEVVMSFEERFNVYIPNDVATKFVTVGDAVDFIEVQVAQAAGSGLVYHPPRPRLAVG
jgi:acyl carrier protein